jgi:hypothetical protein
LEPTYYLFLLSPAFEKKRNLDRHITKMNPLSGFSVQIEYSIRLIASTVRTYVIGSVAKAVGDRISSPYRLPVWIVSSETPPVFIVEGCTWLPYSGKRR